MNSIRPMAPFRSMLLRHTWQRMAGSGLVVACMLAALFVLARLLGTQVAGFRLLLPLGFVLMAASPWVFLQPAGRVGIGLSPARHARWYPIALAVGAALAVGCFIVALGLFGRGADNFFVSIADSYHRAVDTSGMRLLALHAVFTVPALLFSPIGEEIFFRGFLQEALEERFSTRGATVLQAGLFGAVHLCHHGLVMTVSGIVWQPLSGGLWVLLMFATALAFAALRRASGSLYPAIAAHMAFNAMMNVMIFALLWVP